MTTPSPSKTRDLLTLAERMGIPVGEAMRQVSRLIADAEDQTVEETIGEQTIVLSAEPAREPVRAADPVSEREPAPEPDPASASVV
jgi:hypothetical protein